jgi:hypothetical protein
MKACWCQEQWRSAEGEHIVVVSDHCWKLGVLYVVNIEIC